MHFQTKRQINNFYFQLAKYKFRRDGSQTIPPADINIRYSSLNSAIQAIHMSMAKRRKVWSDSNVRPVIKRSPLYLMRFAIVAE
jgi:carbonic anhydrase